MRITSHGAAALIIPTRHRRARLLETLERVAELSGPDVEVVIADNASDDDIAGAVHARFPSAQVIPLEENLQSAARTVAAERARSEFLILLDDDSYPEPGSVEAALAALTEPAVGIAAAHVRLADGWEEGGAHGVHIGCGAAVRRDDFLRWGGYPPIYGTYVEEYDLAYRAWAEGRTVRFVDGFVVRHEPQARSSFDFMVERLTANNVYLAWKFFPGDEAVRWEAWTLRRYETFARRKGALAGWTRAAAAASRKKAEGLRDRIILPEHALDAVIPHRCANAAIKSWRERPSHISFLRAGKEIADLILAARGNGIEIEAVYDEGLLSTWSDIEGAPVRTYADIVRSTPLFIGGLSPGFIRNTRSLAERLGVPAVDIGGGGR